jgi:Na+(H+)/acetate symporter ActP
MPEFLDRRYNSAARYIFAVFCVIGYIVSLIAGPLYAGGLALETMFGMDLVRAVVLLGALTGAYTIYGGLKSAAWTDFMQMGVLLVGGILVPVIGLSKVGGMEAGVFDRDAVGADRQVLQTVEACRVGGRRGLYAGCEIGGNIRLRDYPTLRIGDDAADRGHVGLGRNDSGEKDTCEGC